MSEYLDKKLTEAQKALVINYQSEENLIGKETLAISYRNMVVNGLVPQEARNKELDEALLGKEFIKQEGWEPFDPDKRFERDDGFDNNYSTGIVGHTFDMLGDAVEFGTGGARVAQLAFEKSLTGQAHLKLNNSPKFDELYGPDGMGGRVLMDASVEGSGVGPIEDLLATVLSFSMPLDYATMKVGKDIGGVVSGKNAQRRARAYQKIAKENGKKFSPLDIRTRDMATDNAISGAFPLAMYEGSHGIIHAANEGKSIPEMLLAGAKGVVRGGIIGSLVSGVSGGFLGRRAKVALKNDNAGTWKHLKSLGLNDALSWGASSKAGQIAVESLGFTIGGNIVDTAFGDEVRWNEFGDNLLDNAALFFALKGKHKFFDKTSSKVGEARDYFVKKFEDGKLHKTLKNLNSNIEHKAAAEEANEVLNSQIESIQKEINEASNRFGGLGSELGELQKSIDKIRASINKPKKDGKYTKEHIDAFREAHNLWAKIETFKDDFESYKKSLDPENSVDRARAQDLENTFRDMSAILKDLNSRNNDSANKYLSNVLGGREKAASELQALFMKSTIGEKPFVLIDGKKVPLFTKDPNDPKGESEIINPSVTKEQISEQAHLLKGESSVAEAVNKGYQDLKDFTGENEGTNPGSSKLILNKLYDTILGRRKKLVTDKRYVKGITTDSSGKLIVEFKTDTALTASQQQLFKNSSNFIRDLMMSEYPEGMAGGGKGVKKVGGGGKYVDIDTYTRYVNEIRKFAEYLAKRDKDFSTMSELDIRGWLGMHPGYQTSVSSLLQRLQKLNTNPKMKGKVLLSEVQNIIPEKDLSKWSQEMLSDKDIEYAKGVRFGHFDTIKKWISKLTTKKNVSKHLQMSSPLNNLMKRLEISAKRLLGKENLEKNDIILLAEDGKPFYTSDLNSIVKHFHLEGKLEGGKTYYAHMYRKLFGHWAEIKDVAPQLKDPKTFKAKNNKGETVEISYAFFVDAFGLGHGKSKVNRAELAKQYNISESFVEDIMKKIKAEYDADIEGHISGKAPLDKSLFGKTKTDRYNLIEVIDIIKKISNGEGSIERDGVKGYLIENYVHSKKGAEKKVERFYSKDVVEASLRWMIENPSRLIEVGLKDPSSSPEFRKSLKSKEAEEEIDKTSIEWKALKDHFKKKNPGQWDTKSQSEKNQTIKELLESKDNSNKIIEEYNKDDSYKIEKTELNSQIHSLEGSLRKRGVRIRGLRRKHFGEEEFDVSRRFDVEQFRSYKEELLKQVESETNSEYTKRKVKDSFFPENAANEIAKLLGVKDGDYTKLRGATRGVFLDMVERYSSLIERKFEGPTDISLDKDYLQQLREGFRGRAEQNLFSSWILVQRLKNGTNYLGAKIRKKAKGALKKSLQKYEEFITGFETSEGLLKALAEKEFNEVNKKIRKYFGNSASTNSYWLNPVIMKKMIKDIKSGKLDKEIQELYEKEYEKNRELYENSLIPNTPENIIKREFKASMDRVWEAFETSVINANESIKGSIEYNEILKTLKNMKVEFYVPQVHSKNGKIALEQSHDYRKRIDDLVAESVEKDAEKDTDRFIYKNNPRLKNQSLELKKKDSKYLKEFTLMVEKVRNNTLKMTKKQNDANREVYAKYNSSEHNIDNARFMERVHTSDIFQLVQKPNGKYKAIKSYESDLFKIMLPYIGSTSKYISTIRHASEYIKPRFVANMSKSKWGLKKSLELINRYDQLTTEKNSGETYKYLESLRQEIMGESRSQMSGLWRGVNNVGALAGLSSFAEPGIKNFIQGQANIVAQVGVHNYGRQVFRLLNRTRWRDATERAEEVGAVGVLEQRYFGKTRGEVGYELEDAVNTPLRYVQEGIYKWNWMNRTERINRIVALEAARLTLMEAIDGMTGVNTGILRKAQYEDWIRNTGRFTDKDMDMIKSGEVFEKTPESQKKWERLMDKFDTYSHRATQGGTFVTDVPKWMSGKYKPLVLFQRIATSITTTTVRNVVKPALKYGNFMPLIVYMGAMNGGGEMINYLKSIFYGKDGPVSLSEDTLDRVLYNLWRIDAAAMYGLLLEITPGSGWNPYDKALSGDQALKSSTPFIARVALSAVENLYDGINYARGAGGGKNLEQAFGDFTKEMFVGAKQISRVDKAWFRLGPGYSDADKIQHTKSDVYRLEQNTKNYKKQYLKLKGKYVEERDSKGEFRAQYRSLKEAIRFGTEEEIALNFWHAWSTIVASKEDSDAALGPDKQVGTSRSRANEAYDAIFSSIKHMSPFYISDEIGKRNISEEKSYRRYLKEKGKLKETDKFYKMFKYDYRKFLRIINNQDYRNKYSFKHDLTPKDLKASKRKDYLND